MKRFAKGVSFVLNPFLLFAPFQMLLFWIILGSFDFRFLGVVFFQVVLVFLFVILGIRLGKIEDLDISNVRERRYFCWFVFVMFLASCFFVYPVIVLVLVNLALTFVALVIAICSVGWGWKISGHLAYDATIIFALGYFVDPRLWFLFPLLILVAWSRVVLKKHTIPQVVSGGLLGILVSALFFVVLLG